MSEKKLISVLLTTYNSAQYLNESINSILLQSYNNFELLIVDDGSTDHSEQIISKFNDERLRYEKIEHIGRTNVLNYGLSLCKNEWIALMDADDISHPQRLELQIKYLTHHEEIDWISSWYAVFDTKLRYIFKLPEKSEEIVRNLVFSSSINFPGSLFKKEKILKYGGFKDTIYEDYELLLRHKKQLIFYNIPKILFYNRRRQNSLSNGNLSNLKSIIYNIQEPYYINLDDEFGIDSYFEILSLKGWREYFFGDRYKSINYWNKMKHKLFLYPITLLGYISLLIPPPLFIYVKIFFFRILLFYSPFISSKQKHDFKMLNRKFIKNPRFILFGVKLHLIGESELINIVKQSIDGKITTNIISLDFRHFLLIKQNKLKLITNNTMIYYPDSSGIYFLLKLFYKKEIVNFKRLVSTDFHISLLSVAEENQYKIFLLGDTTETLKSFTEKIKLNYKNIRISGYANGYNDLKNPNLIEEINKSNSDILLIGLSVPDKEIWLFNNSKSLNIPVRITVGAFFTFYSGRINRAPIIFRKLYLEWFYRFMREPQRLFNRYFIQFPKVFFLFLREKWLK